MAFDGFPEQALEFYEGLEVVHIDKTRIPQMAEINALRALRDPDGYGGYGWVTLDRT